MNRSARPAIDPNDERISMDYTRAMTRFLSGLAVIAVIGCGGTGASSPITATNGPQVAQSPPAAPTSLPAAPFSIAAPEPPSKLLEGLDLTTIDGHRLAGAAVGFSNKKDYDRAVQLQHWSVASIDDGRYNLACFQALAGKKEAAFYWLQEAALKEGVDASWAGQDSDLESLRGDSRWARVDSFLKACNAYWAVSGQQQVTVVLPKDYKVGTPIGVAVGMHGLGADPEGFVNEAYQGYADELNMAIIGVSGTVPRGPKSFVWAEDAAKDAERIRRALKEISDRVTVGSGKVVTFGFSQGAQMAFEVAFRYPAEFRGALVMSPGTTKRVNLGGFSPAPANQSQGFVCTCGAEEMPGNVANTRADADLAKRAGSRVELKLYEGVQQHAFPADFREKFVPWIKFIQDGP
jgi:predicted esterase